MIPVPPVRSSSHAYRSHRHQEAARPGLCQAHRQGRLSDKKQLLYKTIADGLNQELKIRREDVFINLVEVKAENWSFGNGVAQYVK